MKIPPWLKCYGDRTYRGDCPPESAEQITFFNRLRAQYPSTYGKIALHPRNEGKRNHRQTARHKAEGMAPGASDIVIPGCPAFVCELKRQDHTKSRWEDDQLDYLAVSRNAGAFVCVALGWEAAWEAFEAWRSALKNS